MINAKNHNTHTHTTHTHIKKWQDVLFIGITYYRKGVNKGAESVQSETCLLDEDIYGRAINSIET
jgi:hypothetical protein